MSDQLAYKGTIIIVLYSKVGLFLYQHLGGISVRPPEHQLSVVSYLMSHIPVDLRHHIVHQPLPLPEEDIGVEIVIVLQTTGLGSDRMGSLISVDAEGTDAELDVGLDATDGL